MRRTVSQEGVDVLRVLQAMAQAEHCHCSGPSCLVIQGCCLAAAQTMLTRDVTQWSSHV